MEILLFINFEKRVNSTKRPLDSDGIRMEVQLKEDTDLLNPTFVLSNTSDAVNYIKWDGRYYFVNNVMHRTNYVTEFDCTVDALASWESYIRATNAHVLYSSTNYTRNLPDPRFITSLKRTATVHKYTLSGANGFFSRQGCIAITTMSRYSNGVNGSVCTYVMAADVFTQFCAELMDQTFWEQLKMEFTNPMEAITEAHWLPFTTATLRAHNIVTPQTMFVGSQSFVNDRAVFAVTNPVLSVTDEFSYHDGGTKDFLDIAPYTSAAIYLPFIGTVPYDAALQYSYTGCKFEIHADVLTGNISYVLNGFGELDIKSQIFNGMCASSIPVGQMVYDPMKVIAGGLTTLAGTATAISGAVQHSAGKALAGLGTAVGGAFTAATGFEQHTQINGQNGGRTGANIGLDIILTLNQPEFIEFYDKSERLALMGLPAQITGALYSEQGYCQTSGFSVSGPMTQTERETINSLLDSGIYFE